jgi:hypothetical protein
VAAALALKRLQVSGLWIPGLPLQLRLELLAQLLQIEQLPRSCLHLAGDRLGAPSPAWQMRLPHN